MPKIWLGVALVAHLALAGTYACKAPAWEGPDENDHAYYASILRATGRQPTIMKSAASTGRPSWEEGSLGHHPPLYYWVLGSLTAVFGSGDYTPCWSPNPAPAGTSALQWQHGHDERAPVSAEIWVLRGLRVFSTLLGALSIVLTYALARVLFPTRPGVAGVASVLLACLPQWSWMHGVLDNGNLATTLATATVVVLAKAVRARRLGLGTGIGVGLLLGTALLTKLTALFLLPLVVAVFALAALSWRDRRRPALVGGLVACTLALAISGTWFVRNATLYGDPLALAPHAIAYASNRLPDDLRASYFGGDFVWRTLHSTFAGVGWSMRAAPTWVEGIGAAVVGLGLVGFAWRGRTLVREGGAPFAIAVAVLLLTVAGYVQFNLSFIQPQGRYLFPALGVVVIVVAAGLHSSVRPRTIVWPALAAAACIGGAVALQHLTFLPLLAPAAPPGPRYASFYEGMHTVGAPARRTIVPRAPDAGAVLADAPTFSWLDPDAPRGAAYSVHVWFPSGITFATWESAHLPIGAHEWAMPAGLWSALPRGETLHWRVRRVPDRARGEAMRDQPESALLPFVRQP